MFDDAKKALENDLMELDYDKRPSFLRGFLDYVLNQYEKAILDAKLFAPRIAYQKQTERDPYRWPKPLPTPRQIIAMTQEEARKYQGMCRFKDGTYWITHDNRFLHEGQGMKFYEAWRKAARARAPSENETAECEHLYGEAKKPAYGLIENEITTEEILEYEQKIKSGEVAFVLKNITTEYLSNNYMHPLQIDGQEWPSVEHYVLAHQFTDSSLRECIRTCRTLTEIRKMIRKKPIRSDWEQVRDDIMRKALEEKFKDPEMRVYLIHTVGFQIHCKGDPYWGETRNRRGELLMELRDRLYKEYENSAVSR